MSESTMSQSTINEEIRDPKAVLDALERAKADAKKYREELESLKSEYSQLERDRDELKQQIEQKDKDTDAWKDRTKEVVVKSRLGSNADRLIKFLDLQSITFNDDGEITGLDEAVSKVKADLPELFDAKQRVAGAADLFSGGGTPKRLTGSEAQVARLFRKG